MTTARPGRTSRPPRPAGRLLAWQRHSEARAAARAEAVVARSVPARLDVGDCDSAPGLLGGRFRASTITCCTGTGRTEGRCDLNHAAVAWPRVAVISSLPAHALLPIVLGISEAGDERDASSLGVAEEPALPEAASIEWPAGVGPTAGRAAEAEVIRCRQVRSITAKSARCWSSREGASRNSAGRRSQAGTCSAAPLASARTGEAGALLPADCATPEGGSSCPASLARRYFAAPSDINDLACGQSTRFPPSALTRFVARARPGRRGG